MKYVVFFAQVFFFCFVFFYFFCISRKRTSSVLWRYRPHLKVSGSQDLGQLVSFC